MILALLLAAAPAASNVAGAATKEAACTGASAAEIVVCAPAPPADRYRIDRSVLEANRAHDAPPAKPELDANAAAAGTACVGPNACTGGMIPLVGMALVAAKAVALAVDGDDWRDALRTHEDEYRLYQQAEARRAKDRKVRIGIGVAK